ncbi:MAG TPA: histidine kinase [Caulobacteraceae bacterium]|jgi:two-component system sensor histidine kinase UhpB
MSLRFRIVVAVVLVLVLGAGFGLALAGWHARQWLREELTSAQESGRLAVLRDYADLRRDPSIELTGLVATFDGNRHLKAVLTNPDGSVAAVSRPTAAVPAPAWFGALLHQDIATIHLAAPGGDGAAIALVPMPDDDVAAVWAEFLDLALVLTLASVGGAALVYVVVGRALRPLSAVGRVLPRIGAGDYAARASERGPPELAALSHGVNEMAARLGAMRARNRALEEQILTLQDEERADIARDLHDEIGPHLFAASVDAAMTASLIGAGRPDEALEQVRAISGAVAHIQRLVRDILGRLRPTRLAELGLASAVVELTRFWGARRPDLAFETELPADDEALSEAVQETLYRLVQESLSNAVRHGAPTRIRIAVLRRGDRVIVDVTNDGAANASADSGGYGLAGMKERVAALGGTLTAGPMDGAGWRVAAVLPIAAPAHEEAA